MSTNRRRGLTVLVIALAVLVSLVLLVNSQLIATENGVQGNQSSGVPHFTVVQTDGLHLIVTDNHASTTYFYAIDEGEKPGADLKLRGSVDLTQIGKQVIKPNLVKRN
jgi:hypothetical protein